MKITFVQNDDELAEMERVAKSGDLYGANHTPKGVWIRPVGLSCSETYEVLDNNDGNAWKGSFKTIDGALMWALGIHEIETKDDWDYMGALTGHGNFI
jgi:hypothetical protein